jgi:hypothetical protein
VDVVMNSMAKSPPLTLLLTDSASGAETRFRALIETDSGITSSQASSGAGHGFEVVYLGVTFRMTISSAVPDLAGLKQIFCNLDPALVGCAIHISLGDHVAGGERVPAIIQALLGVAKKLGTSLGATVTIWHPANIMSGFAYFSEVVADYLGGGAFPVLALVSFKGGDDGLITSNGLALLSGQELLADAGEMDQSEIMRRVVRVVHDIATNGPVRNAVTLAGIEPDEIVELQPLPDGGLLKMNATAAPAFDLS